jgi:hypothetical protein
VDARDRYPAFFSRLEKVRGPNAAGVFAFPCPLHERPTLSGSAWLAPNDGRLMFGCWRPSHGKHALLAALGLSWADTFPDRGKPRRPAVIERTHDYVRADGSLSHQKCIDREREGGKGFWRRWCPRSERWIPGLDWAEKGQSFATERILYRLPELLASSPRLVLITEGERKADLLADLGFVATTAGGATCWLPRYAELIAHRPVCVFPDHNPAGAAFARSVVGSLLVAGCASVRLYEWPPSTPAGWDVGDEIDACEKAGDSAEEMRERVMEYVRQSRHWRLL